MPMKPAPMNIVLRIAAIILKPFVVHDVLGLGAVGRRDFSNGVVEIVARAANRCLLDNQHKKWRMERQLVDMS